MDARTDPEGYEAELGALMCDHSPREIAAEVLRLRAEVERWKAQAFQPLGDNHHNALLCPHCNPEGRRFA